MLKAHTLVEARLYLRISGCTQCGLPLDLTPQFDRTATESKTAAITRLAARCSRCGRNQESDFSIEHPDGVPVPDRPPAINPTEKPSRIIDVGQWLTLSQLFIQESRSEPDRSRARRLNLQAAQCLDEALKFYDDPDNDLPPADAFYCDSSRRRFRESPQSFSRTRLISERRKLPVIFDDPSS